MVIATDVKVAFVDALSATGVAEVEVTAFVAPAWVPQLTDADEVLRRIHRRPGVSYSALVPNEQGLERALRVEPRLDRIAVFTATSESFCHKNVNASIDETFARFRPVLAAAKRLAIPVRGYISTAFWCPFEGSMPPERTIALGDRLLDLGCDVLAISDTLGKATPEETARLLDLALPRFGTSRLALHLHDTYGRAVDNALVAWRMGIEAFDASAGGIGGCPYAPGAPGNVATEPLARALEAAGADLHLDYAAIARARALISPVLGGAMGERQPVRMRS